jgi:hypothetical protein
MIKELSAKIQEIKELPSVLKTRDSTNLIDGKVKQKNRIFPETNKISFNNFILGF